jgi:hypothetical protein
MVFRNLISPCLFKLSYVKVVPAVLQLGRQLCLSLNLLEASLYSGGFGGANIAGSPFYGPYGRKESASEEDTPRKF